MPRPISQSLAALNGWSAFLVSLDGASLPSNLVYFSNLIISNFPFTLGIGYPSSLQ
jgi:hypothetical protein